MPTAVKDGGNMTIPQALIVLHENTGSTFWDEDLSERERETLRSVFDFIAETFEDYMRTLQSQEVYNQIHLLTDDRCNRIELLEALIEETNKGRAIDLIVLGHGQHSVWDSDRGRWAEPSLGLKDGPITEAGIRVLLEQAREQGVNAINLRMVYMCNCYGSIFNDDWIALGAKVSIGPTARSPLHEPATTFFMKKWQAGMEAHKAAEEAYNEALVIYRPFISEAQVRGSVPVVEGKGECTINSIPVYIGLPRADIPSAYGSVTPANTVVWGSVALEANAPGASAIDFAAYYATDPADVNSVSWHNIGRGRRAGGAVWKGFWDTNDIPDQGNPGWGTVNLKAGAIDADDHIDDYQLVEINNDLSIAFQVPNDGQVIYKVARLKVYAPEAPTVSFSAQYATIPDDSSTRHWHNIGRVRSDDHGQWTLDFDTRDIPDQSNVILRASTHTIGGQTAFEDRRRVFVNNHSVKFMWADEGRSRPLRGTVQLNAYALGASSVAFSVLLESDDPLRSEEVIIGEGRRGRFPNEWKIEWDTTTVSNGNAILLVKLLGGYGRGGMPPFHKKSVIINN